MTAMPYIITTKQQRPVALVTGDSPAYDVISRRAVATLDEIYSAGILGRGVVLPESGGTVGPLSDGTVIEVEPEHVLTMFEGLPHADRLRLIGELPTGFMLCPAEGGIRLICDAFNARESSQ